MKVFVTNILLLFSSIVAISQVQIKCSNLPDINVQNAIEKNTSNLLNAINSYYDTQKEVNFASIEISKACKESILERVKESNLHYTKRGYVQTQCIYVKSKQTYEIRIPLVNNKNTVTLYTISFNANGNIEEFYKCRKTENLTNGLKYAELSEKEKGYIITFLTQLNRAYNQGNMDFLRKVFSEDALIIVGNVVKQKPSDIHPIEESMIYYYRRTTDEYLHKLQSVYSSNSKVLYQYEYNVEKDAFQHPNPNYRNYVGVQVHQKFSSDYYTDDGWIFLLWDFSDLEKPTIEIRTWQPGEYVNSRSDVFNLCDFSL